MWRSVLHLFARSVIVLASNNSWKPN
jgi:hypothetical protein